MNTIIIIAVVVILFIVYNSISNRGIAQIGGPQAKSIAESADSLILDVRTPGEFKGGHIKGARNIPVSDLVEHLASLGNDKNKRLLVYCASGGRSSTACRILKKHKFVNISNIRGGMSTWNGNGYQTIKGT